jgi:protein required for attachment to host cells
LICVTVPNEDLLSCACHWNTPILGTDTMKKPVTWILIADGSRAKIFEAAGKGKILQKSELSTPHPPSRDLASDRPGRTFDSMGDARHAKQPPTDPHDKAEADFLRSLVKQLEVSQQKKEFDKLVVVAAPRALGTLRGFFPGHLTNSVAREIAHDLTWFETPAIEAYLKEHEVI